MPTSPTIASGVSTYFTNGSSWRSSSSLPLLNSIDVAFGGVRNGVSAGSPLTTRTWHQLSTTKQSRKVVGSRCARASTGAAAAGTRR